MPIVPPDSNASTQSASDATRESNRNETEPSAQAANEPSAPPTAESVPQTKPVAQPVADDDDDELMVGIFAGGVLKDAENLKLLSTAGFNSLLAWSIHIGAEGDLIWNNVPPIVSGGEWVGPPDFPAMIAKAFAPPSSLAHLIFSVGSWGSQDFATIRRLMAAHGDTDANPLRANFAALKRTIPAVEVIDMDNEDDFHVPTMVAFSKMLAGLGFKVSFCPYHRMDYWSACLKQLYSVDPKMVVAYHLQCYAGGRRNASRFGVRTWIDSVMVATGMSRRKASKFVRPGLWCKHNHANEMHKGHAPMELTAELQDWKDLGLRGAWLWIFDDVLNFKDVLPGIDTTADAYAGSIMMGLL